jgi:hypothetical protein
MKTTIELPDELLSRAKSMAAERRTTLKSMIEHALRRELMERNEAGAMGAHCELNEHGFPVLKAKGGGNQATVTSETVYRLIENEDR